MSKELIAPEMEGLINFLSTKEAVQNNITGKRIFPGDCLYSLDSLISGRSDIKI